MSLDEVIDLYEKISRDNKKCYAKLSQYRATQNCKRSSSTMLQVRIFLLVK